MKKLLLFILLVCATVQAYSQEYPKVVLSGDYPDPSVMRDGEDYYMTHSPFYYAPGFLIWHSRDLMNWEPVCRVMPEYEGSAMAPDLLKYKGKYYIYYPAKGTNWVIWANDIKGPWSKPIDLKVSGIDPGHIADQEGNRYLYVDKGEVIRLTDDGLATIGQKQKVYEGWRYPNHWETECMCLESPKLNYHNGYYYLTSAQGGTAGPATSHMAVAARSKSVTGPWENSPYNPVVHTYSAHDNWWSKGHGALIDDVNGTGGSYIMPMPKAITPWDAPPSSNRLNGPPTDGIEPNPPPLPSRPIRPLNTDSTSRMISQDRNRDSNGLSGKNMPLSRSASRNRLYGWMRKEVPLPMPAYC